MKRILSVGLMAGLMALGVQSKAEAVVSLGVLICQGATCVPLGSAPGPGPFTNNNIVVGDFTVSGSVSSLENVALSNAATVTIEIQRVSMLNDAQGDSLDIWLNASGYNVPVGPGYVFKTTLSGTSSGSPVDAQIAMQGWLDFANGTAMNPAVGLSAGPQGCTLDAGTDACNAGTLSLATGPDPNNPPYSMTTRTRITISEASAIATYTTNAQANITAVPEPGSMMLLGTGLFGLARVARRRFSQAR